MKLNTQNPSILLAACRRANHSAEKCVLDSLSWISLVELVARTIGMVGEAGPEAGGCAKQL
jgi:hypothetical protein